MADQISIKQIIDQYCINCHYYHDAFGVCAGKMLPVEKAIERNLDGHGLCDEVKKYVQEVG